MRNAPGVGQPADARSGRARRADRALQGLMQRLAELHRLDDRVKVARPGSPEYEAAAADLDSLSKSLMDQFREADLRPRRLRASASLRRI
jgi:hypothetical protein